MFYKWVAENNSRFSKATCQNAWHSETAKLVLYNIKRFRISRRNCVKILNNFPQSCFSPTEGSVRFEYFIVFCRSACQPDAFPWFSPVIRIIHIVFFIGRLLSEVYEWAKNASRYWIQENGFGAKRQSRWFFYVEIIIHYGKDIHPLKFVKLVRGCIIQGKTRAIHRGWNQASNPRTTA